MKADGSGKRQLTGLNAASFAPSFFPDGKRVIFCDERWLYRRNGNFELTRSKWTALAWRITSATGCDGSHV